MGLWTDVANAWSHAFEPVSLPGYYPQPKQETASALADEVGELLYGGAAGGGKSYWIRHDAVLFCLNHPGAHVGIVRRTMPMLKQTHLTPLRTIADGLAVHNRTESTWTFANGSVLRLLSLQHEGDEQNYKSVEFDRLYFDEVTELIEDMYTYMLSRLRSSFAGWCQACNQFGHKVTSIAVSNPEGVGFAWVKRRFVKPRATDLAPGQEMPEAYKPWKPPLPDGSGPGRPRVFVPATIFDNPALLKANPEYVLQLKAIPDARKRKALMDGDWDAMDQVPGALFSLSAIGDYRVHAAPDSLARVVVGYDPATTFTEQSDETGIIAAGSMGGQHYVLADKSGHFSGPEEAARSCILLAAKLGADRIVYETNQGGRYVESALKNALQYAQQNGHWSGPPPRIVGVHAKRGKALRAEPVAVLYSQGKVHHAAPLEELETQMTTWTPESPSSPDRLDALVYAITYLGDRRPVTGGGILNAW